jgi:hypothetical protein
VLIHHTFFNDEQDSFAATSFDYRFFCEAFQYGTGNFHVVVDCNTRTCIIRSCFIRTIKTAVLSACAIPVREGPAQGILPGFVSCPAIKVYIRHREGHRAIAFASNELVVESLDRARLNCIGRVVVLKQDTWASSQRCLFRRLCCCFGFDLFFREVLKRTIGALVAITF